MARTSKPLFSRTKFSDYEREKKKQMAKEISELSTTELENSTDFLTLFFTSKYSPAEIRIHEPVHEDAGQVEEVVRTNPTQSLPGLPRRRGRITRTLQRLKLKVPYTGEKDLLFKQPRRMSGPPPTYDELTDQEIVHYVDYMVKGKEPVEIKETLEKEITNWQDKLDRYTGFLNKDIRKMRESFENQARNLIEEHRKNMSAKDEALAELGISTQNVEEGFVVPEKKKEIEIPDLEGSQQEKLRIKDQTFVDLLDIIDSMRVSIERSKQRLRDLDEESLRHIILGAIESHYGQVTAETFNRGGKTDILLKHQGENLFIAECKFWTGKKGLQEAIDQLLGNLTADDGHASLIIFSRRQNLVEVRDRAIEAIKAHDSFQSVLTRFENHGVYRFQKLSGTKAKVAMIIVDLGS